MRREKECYNGISVEDRGEPSPDLLISRRGDTASLGSHPDGSFPGENRDVPDLQHAGASIDAKGPPDVA